MQFLSRRLALAVEEAPRCAPLERDCRSADLDPCRRPRGLPNNNAHWVKNFQVPIVPGIEPLALKPTSSCRPAAARSEPRDRPPRMAPCIWHSTQIKQSHCVIPKHLANPSCRQQGRDLLANNQHVEYSSSIRHQNANMRLQRRSIASPCDRRLSSLRQVLR